MLKKFFAIIIAVTFLPSHVIYAASRPDSFADLVESAMPAVVNISTTQKIPEKDLLPQQSPFSQMPPGSLFDEFREFFDKLTPEQGPLGRNPTSLGSGFIIDASGYVVTNNHVIAEAEEISVILSDDTTLEAKIVGRDVKTDLALLKVETKKKLPYVTFGDSDKIRVGDWVVAIGNPFGLGGSVSAGIISARARDINAGPFDDFLQTDAAINRGNSGGPMFDTDGKVIGINTAIYSPSGGSVGIGFAVPAALAQPIIKQLKESGQVERGWLGVKIQDVTKDIAESMGMKKPLGALVVEVTKDSPADKGGLLTGDIITSFAGKDIPEMRKLPRIVAETKIGDSVPATVLRKGKKKTVKIKVGRLDESRNASSQQEQDPMDAPAMPEGSKEILGMTIVPLSKEYRQDYEISSDINGLLVIDVERSGGAARKGIQPGDVISSANQESVRSVNALLKVLTNAKIAGRPSVLLLVMRNGESRFLALPLSSN